VRLHLQQTIIAGVLGGLWQFASYGIQLLHQTTQNSNRFSVSGGPLRCATQVYYWHMPAETQQLQSSAITTSCLVEIAHEPSREQTSHVKGPTGHMLGGHNWRATTGRVTRSHGRRPSCWLATSC